MFFVTGLPRSRTAWFAAYFTALGHKCVHEGLDGLHEKDEFNELMARFEGNADHCLPLTDFQERFPDARTLVIHRPPNEVQRSLAAIGLVNPDLMGQARALWEVKGMHVPYHQINESLPAISRYLGLNYDEDIAKVFKNMRIVEHVWTSDPKSLALWSS